jgi:hypothetical protein
MMDMMLLEELAELESPELHIHTPDPTLFGAVSDDRDSGERWVECVCATCGTHYKPRVPKPNRDKDYYVPRSRFEGWHRTGL